MFPSTDRRPAARARASARRLPCLLLLALAASAACTPSTQRYQTLRDDWARSAPAGAPESAGQSPDTLFRGVARLHREALVDRVLERNPNARAARYAWRAALARYPQATALDDPMLGAGAAPRSFGSSTVDDAVRLELSQKLPFPGKRRLRGEAALGEAEAAAHDHAVVRLRLATVASLLFDDYRLAVRSLEINDEHVALLEDLHRIALARYESGEASQQDPLQAEVAGTHALRRSVELETERRIAVEQINALLHRPPGLPLPPPAAWEGDGVPLEAPDPEGDPTRRALERRPDLAAAAARVAAEEARLDLARRESYPDVTLVGAYNGVMQESDLQPFVGLQLNLPVRLGRRRAAVEEARARVEVARSRQAALEDDVRLEVRSGADRVDEARQVTALYRDRLVPAARDQVEAARSGFETGRNGFPALIDAQRGLLDAELGLARWRAELGRRSAELERALGRLPGRGR